MSERKFAFDTQQLHAGQTPDGDFRARAVPIYQSTSFTFRDFNTAKDINTFDNCTDYEYSRTGNPTNSVLEARIAALEGGTAALAVSSGMAAITYAILNVCQTGDDIVAARTLYGGTFGLFAHTLPRHGITVTLVDPDDHAAIAAAIGPRTKALYTESIGNPGGNIIDIPALAAIAKQAGIPLIVDNTFSTPYLFRPIEHGANVVIHSATKYIGGHGTTIGGLIVDGGNFDWGNGKFPGFTTPDGACAGITHWDKWHDFPGIGNFVFVMKTRLQYLRDMGAALSPFNAFLLLQGIETLSLRMQRQIDNAARVATHLAASKHVSRVQYAGLAGSPYFGLAQKYYPKGPGAIFSFDLKGGDDAARKFTEAVKVFSFLANVGDSKSLIVHPASVTHPQLSPQEQLAAGITPGSLRVSIGTEAIEDLLWDLDQAFAAL
ncbi:MAG: O-acetylhomoserine aminocarboxypropyltransferase/cysteine synthase family protein [Rhizomicrobium sp.]